MTLFSKLFILLLMLLILTLFYSCELHDEKNFFLIIVLSNSIGIISTSNILLFVTNNNIQIVFADI